MDAIRKEVRGFVQEKTWIDDTSPCGERQAGEGEEDDDDDDESEDELEDAPAVSLGVAEQFCDCGAAPAPALGAGSASCVGGARVASLLSLVGRAASVFVKRSAHH